MKTKVQKRDEARKTAEAQKAAKKTKRQQSTATMATNTGPGKKGKSAIPQSKTKK